MEQKLKCVIMENDMVVMEALNNMCHDVPYAEVVGNFERPEKFLEISSGVDFDTCLLEMDMPGTDGFSSAEKVNNKSLIFITGNDGRLRQALDYSPVGIITKPIKRERLHDALWKAYNLYSYKRSLCREYKLFNVVNSGRKVNIHAPDILFVSGVAGNPGNKHIYLKNGEHYLLTGCTFEELLDFSPTLIRVNKTDMVSIQAVHEVEQNIIILKNGIVMNKGSNNIILSRLCKKDFFEKML